MKIFFLLFILSFQFVFALNDLGPHPQKSNTYNEFWTYHFFLENDMNVFLNYSRANVGSFKDPVCGADLVVQNFKGKNYNMAREKPKSAFKYHPSTYKLEVHPNIWFQGNPKEKQRVFFNTSKKGVSYLVDLELTEYSSDQVIQRAFRRLTAKLSDSSFIFPKQRFLVLLLLIMTH